MSPEQESSPHIAAQHGSSKILTYSVDRKTSPPLNTALNEQNEAATSKPTNLLALPAEIRNLIYSYVFPSGTALKYYSPDEAAYFRHISGNLSKFARTRSTKNPDERTEETSESPRWKKPMFSLDVDENGLPLSYNPLGKVCKQLDKETAGLEIKYNDLLFSRLDDRVEAVQLAIDRGEIAQEAPADMFLAFVGSMPAAKLAWLRKVTIVDWRECSPLWCHHRKLSEASARVTQVAAICRANTNLLVLYQLPYQWRTNPLSKLALSMSYGMASMLALRNVDLTAINHPMLSSACQGNAFIEDMMAWGRDLNVMQAIQAPNLRFCISNDSFDEAKFRAVVAKLVQQLEDLGGGQIGQDWLDVMYGPWVSFAKAWVEHGI